MGKTVGKAAALLSGPGGLASFLRRRQLGARLGGPSLPLDVGVNRDIPAAIRRAVILRDQHCRFPGGYYILDLPDLDSAIDWAARCPGARAGRIEVRPIQEFGLP